MGDQYQEIRLRKKAAMKEIRRRLVHELLDKHLDLAESLRSCGEIRLSIFTHLGGIRGATAVPAGDSVDFSKG